MNKCIKHPKYKGKHLPKHECTECLSLYFKMHTAPRVLPRPTKTIKSKKQYSRKDKHKKRAI